MTRELDALADDPRTPSTSKWTDWMKKWKAFEKAALDGPKKYALAESGNWKIERRTISKDEAALHQMRSAMHGSRRYTPAGTYTGIKRGGALIMSNVPDEISDLRDLCEHATGRVLVNGLGLGCAVWGLLSIPAVTEIVVVENSPDVLKLVTPYFQKWVDAKRVRFVEADAFTVKWPKGTYWDAVWHDIWDELCTDDLKEHTKLKRKYARSTEWQAAWCQEYLRYQRERERRSGW